MGAGFGSHGPTGRLVPTTWQRTKTIAKLLRLWNLMETTPIAGIGMTCRKLGIIVLKWIVDLFRKGHGGIPLSGRKGGLGYGDKKLVTMSSIEMTNSSSASICEISLRWRQKAGRYHNSCRSIRHNVCRIWNFLMHQQENISLWNSILWCWPTKFICTTTNIERNWRH